ncbi:TlpA family protein disulfide reductase [Ancylomarina euxinus]|uniref:TlpA family protein disulfide reductase n=1 Tax=Ancylomarina euxinus TaxID=2283627 RepID=A0A425XZ48_9BACT|nr:TlpA disulfide reductase family protein [Ancylomarina euxinus]MCZ4695599.1 TlpA disulfide reductase family protein [Ancylomarina euxinus]MUP15980.1 redoxin family protein [Ancylomarina euxinus]RRG20422.1 TlpA family protein disulfide reductase [Ancylomarina euxinus]
MIEQESRRYMKRLFLVLFVFGWIACSHSQQKVVRLKGQLVNFEKVSIMENQDPQAILLKEGIEIHLDDSNHFELEIGLERPSYFRLGRNTLYLQPGYNMEIYLDYNSPVNAKFKGIGAEPNRYLKHKPFPKGGSFLEAGKIMKSNCSYEFVKKEIENRLLAYMDSLTMTPNLTENFIELEKTRNYLNAAISFNSYPAYLGFAGKFKDEDEYKAALDEVAKIVPADFHKYVGLAGVQSSYLQLEEFRTVVFKNLLHDDKLLFTNEIDDFVKTYMIINQLGSQGPVKEVLSEKVKVAQELKTDDYKSVLNQAFEKYNSLLPGQLAPDFQLTDLKGKRVSKTDFKGKILVVDIWATWCGPCKAESPYFEALAKEFANEELAFISVCIDSEDAVWRKYLEKHEKTSLQYMAERSEFQAYFMNGIPRFMVFDKKGKIIDAFAPRPSDERFRQVIQQVL